MSHAERVRGGGLWCVRTRACVSCRESEGGCGVYVHVRVSHAERVRGVVVCTYTCVCLMQRE